MVTVPVAVMAHRSFSGGTRNVDVTSTFLLPPLNGLWAVTGMGTVDVRILQPEGDY